MKKSRFLWMVPALLSAILFFGCERKPGEKLYHEGLAEWKAGNLVRARVLLEKSIRRRAGSAGNADAYNRLGLLLWEMEEVDSAADAFAESCRIDSGKYGSLCNLGIALRAQNDFAEAERTFREAALLNPDDSRPLTRAGIAYLQNRKWDDALRNLRRALKRTPDDPQLQTMLALTELNTLGVTAALKRLQAVTRKHPGYAPAFFNQASIHLHWQKNLTAAKNAFEQYLAKAPDDAPHSALARAHLQKLSGANTPATPARSALTIKPSEKADRKKAEEKFQQALARHRAGNLQEAIALYIQALEADNTYERAFYNLGLACYASGEMLQAGEAFEQAVKLNPAFTEARYNAALVDHYHLGKPDRALRELHIVLEQQPDYRPAIDLLKRIR